MYQGEGTLDLSIVRTEFGSAYFVFPLIENNLPSSSKGSLDPNEIQLSGFQVDIKWIDAPPPAAIQKVFAERGEPLVHYQIPWSGGISSGGGPSLRIRGGVPCRTCRELSAAGGIGTSPSVTVKLHDPGARDDQQRNQHGVGSVQFPVHVCSGCLVASRRALPVRGGSPNPGNSCNPAQDLPVDCCTENGALICPRGGGVSEHPARAGRDRAAGTARLHHQGQRLPVPVTHRQRGRGRTALHLPARSGRDHTPADERSFRIRPTSSESHGHRRNRHRPHRHQQREGGGDRRGPRERGRCLHRSARLDRW